MDDVKKKNVVDVISWSSTSSSTTSCEEQQPPNIAATGSAIALIEYLYHERFQNQFQSTMEFIEVMKDHLLQQQPQPSTVVSSTKTTHLADVVQSSREHNDNSITIKYAKTATDNNNQNHHSSSSILGKSLMLPGIMPSSEATDSASMVEVTCIQPRIKMNLSLYEQGCKFVDKKGDSVVLLSNQQQQQQQPQQPHSSSYIQQVVVFPQPNDCRNSRLSLSNSNNPTKKNQTSGGDMILFVLSSSSSNNNGTAASTTTSCYYKNKPLSQICFQLPTTTTTAASDHNSNNTLTTTTTDMWMEVLCNSLDLNVDQNVARIHVANEDGVHSSSSFFKSYSDPNTSSTVSGLPFVSCYMGVQDGVLYPTVHGLLFYKPPRFIHRSTMHSIECTTGSNRYVTLSVVIVQSSSNKKERIEFTNIHKQEESGLRHYIHEILVPAMQRDNNDTPVNNSATPNNNDNDSNHENESNSSTNDDDVANHHSGEGGGQYPNHHRSRPKRQAASVAEGINKRFLSEHQQQLAKQDADDDNEEEEYRVDAVESSADEEDDDDDDETEDTMCTEDETESDDDN